MRFTCGLLLAILFSAGCREPIQHALDERQANEVQSTLAERGFDVTKVMQPGRKPTWSIEVPGAQATDAVRALSELGLPRPRTEGISDVFGKGSLVPTPTEERALYQGAVSGELAQTLEAVDGVVSARVHVVLPPPPRPGAAQAPAKASALIRVRPGKAGAVEKMREDLRAVIAGGVEGLTAEQVTLVISEVVASTVARSKPSPQRPLLRLAMAGLGTAISVLSAALIWAALRHRRIQRAGPIRAVPSAQTARHISAVPTRPPTRRGGA